MSKIFITEKQCHTLFKEALKECFLAENIGGAQIRNTQREISDRIAKKIEDGDESVISTMNRVGFNITSRSKEERAKIVQSLMTGGKISREVSDEVLNAAIRLKQFILDNGGIDRNKMSRELSPNEIDYLLRMRDMLDRLGLNGLYDSSIKKIDDDPQFGLSYNEDGSFNTDDFDLNTYTSNKLKAFGDSEVKLYTSLLNRYVDSKYGINLSIPNVVFSNGSLKLPKDTLIINFSAAERCTAWNECIVKNACYARSLEKFRGGIMQANSARNVMWEAGHSDPEFLKLLFRLIREYVVNYRNLSISLKKIGIEMTKEELSEMHFSEMPQEAIDIINSGDKRIKRINDIRLNENGDFLGQWLIDAIDKEAEDFESIETRVTAYTCRNLNYEGIKHIVLNASNKGIKGPSVARRFYALEEDVYDSYDETYGGPNNSLEIINDTVQQNPQKLYKDGVETGEYYYKCPCGRLDKEGAKKKADCYMCRTCYMPNQFDKPYYVFVRVHGSSKEEFNGNRKNMNEFGVSKNFDANYAEIMSKKRGGNKNQEMVAEGLNKFNPNAQNNAINQIAHNAINSMNEHLNNL